MPKKGCILNLPKFTLQKVSGKNSLILHVRYRRKACCAFCDSKQLRKKDVFYRQVRHPMLSRRRTYLSFKAFKFQSKQCSRYFNQRFPGILKYQRASETLKEEIFTQHTQGVDQKTLSTHFLVGKNTIQRWYHQLYRHKSQHSVHQHCPSALGIDEHRFSRQQDYLTTLCDLKRHNAALKSSANV